MWIFLHYQSSVQKRISLWRKFKPKIVFRFKMCHLESVNMCLCCVHLCSLINTTETKSPPIEPTHMQECSQFLVGSIEIDGRVATWHFRIRSCIDVHVIFFFSSQESGQCDINIMEFSIYNMYRFTILTMPICNAILSK